MSEPSSSPRRSERAHSATIGDGGSTGSVWLVLDNNGAVIAVLEDDADYAAKVAETNRGWGWKVERRLVRRAK